MRMEGTKERRKHEPLIVAFQKNHEKARRRALALRRSFNGWFMAGLAAAFATGMKFRLVRLGSKVLEVGWGVFLEDSDLDNAGMGEEDKTVPGVPRQSGDRLCRIGMGILLCPASQRPATSFLGIGRAHRGSGFGYACFKIREYLREIIGFLCCFPSVDGGAFDWRRQAAAKRFRVVPVSESNVRKRGEIRWAGWLFVR